MNSLGIIYSHSICVPTLRKRSHFKAFEFVPLTLMLKLNDNTNNNADPKP